MLNNFKKNIMYCFAFGIGVSALTYFLFPVSRRASGIKYDVLGAKVFFFLNDYAQRHGWNEETRILVNFLTSFIIGMLIYILIVMFRSFLAKNKRLSAQN